MIPKVGAYIIRQAKQGPQLLVFAHEAFPEVPVQIPGGTIEKDESPEAALHREIEEESGLNNLSLIRKLGVGYYFWETANDKVEGHCYLLQAPDDVPDSWRHVVRGNGEDSGLVFLYSWRFARDLTLGGVVGQFLCREHIPELYD